MPKSGLGGIPVFTFDYEGKIQGKNNNFCGIFKRREDIQIC